MIHNKNNKKPNFYITERKSKYTRITKSVNPNFKQYERHVIKAYTPISLKITLRQRNSWESVKKEVDYDPKKVSQMSYFAMSRYGLFTDSIMDYLPFCRMAIISEAASMDDILGDYGLFAMIVDYVNGNIDFGEDNLDVVSYSKINKRYLDMFSVVVGSIESDIPGNLLSNEDRDLLRILISEVFE